MIKNFLINNPLFLYIYNIIKGSNFWRYRKSVKCSGAILDHVSFLIKGNNVLISIAKGVSLHRCCFRIDSSDSHIFIGNGSTIHNTTFWLEDKGSSIKIGNNFTMQGGQLSATESKSKVIGDGCMFSSGIDIRNGDSHGIYSMETRQRINHASSIVISDYVWLAKNVTVLKGAHIASNVVVGSGSLVSKELEQSNAIYSGLPAKLIKEKIKWTRSRYVSEFVDN